MMTKESLFWKLFFIVFVQYGAVQADEITFNCDAGGLITGITHPNTNEDLIVIKTGSNTYCHYNESDCKLKTNLAKLDVIIQTDSNKLLIAGHKDSENKHYLIECKDEYDVTVKASMINVSPAATQQPSTVSKTATPPQSVSMKIYKDTKLVDKAVNIGDELKLVITSSDYLAFPTSCTAVNDDSKSETVNIWIYTSQTGDGSGCSTFDPAITVQTWTRNTDTSISIPIYAFRFTTSQHVLIRCSVHLCKGEHCSSTCETSRRRRRRSPPKEKSEGRTEETYVSFSVASENKVPNKANVMSARFAVVVTSIILGIRLVRFL